MYKVDIKKLANKHVLGMDHCSVKQLVRKLYKKGDYSFKISIKEMLGIYDVPDIIFTFDTIDDTRCLYDLKVFAQRCANHVVHLTKPYHRYNFYTYMRNSSCFKNIDDRYTTWQRDAASYLWYNMVEEANLSVKAASIQDPIEAAYKASAHATDALLHKYFLDEAMRKGMVIYAYDQNAFNDKRIENTFIDIFCKD